MKVKVTYRTIHGDIREYKYIPRVEQSPKQWFLEDEIDFLHGLGTSGLEDDGTVERERWQVDRLNKLLRYQLCLTLRNDFGSINKAKLEKALAAMIRYEIKEKHIPPHVLYSICNIEQNLFNEMNKR